MTTEVVHGVSPSFKSHLTGGRFSLSLVGYYTDVAVDPARVRSRRFFLYEAWRWLSRLWTEVEPDTQGVGAGGVVEVRWNSARQEKRVNELLVMRTVFRDFYEKELRKMGHSATGAYKL